MNAKELKKLARSLKMPGAAKVDEEDGRIRWSKSGGYAGEKAISKTYKAAKALGFTEKKFVSKTSPDGSYASASDVLVKNNIEVRFGSSAGVVASENYYSITVVVKSPEKK